MLAMELDLGQCMICTMDLKAEKGEKLVFLGCHPKHCLHELCWIEYSTHKRNRNEGVTCPIDNKVIEDKDLKFADRFIEKNQVSVELEPQDIRDSKLNPA